MTSVHYVTERLISPPEGELTPNLLNKNTFLADVTQYFNRVGIKTVYEIVHTLNQHLHFGLSSKFDDLRSTQASHRSYFVVLAVNTPLSSGYLALIL